MDSVGRNISLRLGSVVGDVACLPLQRERVLKQPRIVLPFGIQVPKRKRRDGLKHCARADAVALNQPSAGAQVLPSISESGHPAQSVDSLGAHVAMSGSECDSGSASTLTSRSSSSASSASSSSSNSDSEPEVPEALAVEIEDQIEAVVEQFEALPEHNVKTTTFFNSQVGVLEVSLAPSRGKPASCYHCSVKILKETIRFTYSYNIRRPWKFIHGSCLFQFLNRLDSQQAIDQAVTFCHDFLSKSDQSQHLRDAVSQLRFQLNAKSATSSSSTD